MIIKRKEFLQIGSLATASMMLPKFLKAFEGQAMAKVNTEHSLTTSLGTEGYKWLGVIFFAIMFLHNDPVVNGANPIIPVTNRILWFPREHRSIKKGMKF